MVPGKLLPLKQCGSLSQSSCASIFQPGPDEHSTGAETTLEHRVSQTHERPVEFSPPSRFPDPTQSA